MISNSKAGKHVVRLKNGDEITVPEAPSILPIGIAVGTRLGATTKALQVEAEERLSPSATL